MTASTIISKISWTAFTLILISCKAQSFSGGENGTAPAKPEPVKPVSPGTPTNPVPTSCTEAKLLSLKSLKNFVDQNQPNPTIDVEMTFEPCTTQQTELQLPLAFDLDADIDFSGSRSQTITYEVTTQGIPANQGSLRFIPGTDLFNKTGSQFGYFEASSPMRASPSISVAILKLNLQGIKILGRAQSRTPARSNFQMPLHVRIGQSTPVTGEITFTPAR